MKTYRFECYDSEQKKQINVEFCTESESWSGFDGPVYEFFNFLKGCGYVFYPEDELGVMRFNRDGSSEFVGVYE